MKNLLENYTLLFVMTILTAFAILLKCISAIIYQVLLRDSEQIANTKNKWMRTMHTKFEACYKLRIPVHNPSCFVKNYMEHYHFLGLSMKTLENTDIFCALIISGTTLLCIMGGLYYELPVRWIFIHAMTYLFFLLFLATSELLFQVRHKRKVLHLQLLNYFENTLQGKLENEYLYPEENEAYRQAYFEKDSAKPADSLEEKPDRPALETASTQDSRKDPMESQEIEYREEYGSVLSADMQELIDSLLEESKITKELEQQKDKLMTAATAEKFQLVEEIMKEYL